MNYPVAYRFRLKATVIATLVLVSGVARSVRAQSDPIFEDDFDTLDESAWTVIPYPPNRPFQCDVQEGAISACWIESVNTFEPSIELEMSVRPYSFDLLLGRISDDDFLSVNCHYSFMPELIICSASCRTNGEYSEVGVGFEVYVDYADLRYMTLWVSWSQESLMYVMLDGTLPIGGDQATYRFSEERLPGGKIRLQLAGDNPVDYIKVFAPGGSEFGQYATGEGGSPSAGTGGSASAGADGGSSGSGGEDASAGDGSSGSGGDSAGDGGPVSGSNGDDGDNGETDATAGSERSSDPSPSGGGCGCRVSPPGAVIDPGAVSLFLAAVTLSLAGFRRRGRVR